MDLVDLDSIEWSKVESWNQNPDFKTDIKGWQGYDDARSGGQYLFWIPEEGGLLKMNNTTGTSKSEAWQNLSRVSPGDVVFMKIRAKCHPDRLKEAVTYLEDGKVSGVHVGFDFRLDDFTMVHEINADNVQSEEWEEKELVFVVPAIGTFWNPAKQQLYNAVVPANTRAVFHISMFPTGARQWVLIDYAVTKIIRASAIGKPSKDVKVAIALLAGLFAESREIFK